MIVRTARIFFGLALTLAVLGFAQSGHAQSLCWPGPGPECYVKANSGAFAIVVDPGTGSLILVLGKKSTGLADSAVSVPNDLRARVERGEMNIDEANLLLRELAGFDGAAYHLPTVERLRKDLGFPAEMQVLAEDSLELIRTHLQLSLSASQPSASYLGSRMGLQRPLAPVVVGPKEAAVEKKEDGVEIPAAVLSALPPEPEVKPEIKPEAPLPEAGVPATEPSHN